MELLNIYEWIIKFRQDSKYKLKPWMKKYDWLKVIVISNWIVEEEDSDIYAWERHCSIIEPQNLKYKSRISSWDLTETKLLSDYKIH